MIAVLYAAVAGVADVIGGWIVAAGGRRTPLMLHVLTAFGAGFMLAVAVLEMLPAAMAHGGGLTAVLAGYLAVHLTQHTLTPHFHFGEETHKEAMVSRGIGVWALIGLLPHSFFDGVAISGGFAVTADLGLLIFGAVLLHKVPTGMSLASVMMVSGSSAAQALGGVALIGAATVLGALTTPALDVLANYGLGLAAGVTIYVAASNLIPESQRQPGWFVPGAVFLGVVIFYLARLLLPAGV
ncbi:MAG: ZIP family metal transporter [Gemmatimonadetes bacterium]|nr:ZIP family metal transporter [Gemmatimonadota bacterium]